MHPLSGIPSFSPRRISAAVVCQGKPSRCPSPSVPEGVYYTGSRDVGSTIQFHCPEGDMPVGATEAECLDSGEWSSLEPVTCKHVDCGQGRRNSVENRRHLRIQTVCRSIVEDEVFVYMFQRVETL